jgi:hypothetical protein
MGFEFKQIWSSRRPLVDDTFQYHSNYVIVFVLGWRTGVRYWAGRHNALVPSFHSMYLE